MTIELNQRVLAVFREVCEKPERERTAFLETACGDDIAVRKMVETMLRYDSDADEGASHPMRAMLSDLADRAATDGACSTPLPANIGGYRVTRLVARGGMGDVYEGRQENPDRRVAIKVARGVEATGEAARRFELEAQLLARLQHPRIAQIIEAGTTSFGGGSQPYFVMEFVEGPSLRDYARAQLPDDRARIELMVALCEPIGFAHAQGVIHRDLKPENVLIEADGAPKVLDFGVAKVESAGGFGAATLRTRAGQVVGTLGYMAPEQLAGTTRELGPEADVYSLGVMLYELLSDRLPHELDGVTLTRALAVVSATDAPLLGVIRPEHRGDIEAVAAKALEKDPRHRYPDASALQRDLERFLDSKPTLARPAGPLGRFAKWTRRNPALATAAFALFVLLASATAILLIKNIEVQTALDDFVRLHDARRLEEAHAAADTLWPTYTQAEGLGRWLAQYRPLTAKIENHRAAVERLAAGAGSFAKAQDRWKYDRLVELVEGLDQFAADDGLLAEVERRHELALSIEERTCTSRSADWDAAIARIGAEGSEYAGLKLEPQVGLIPLGVDPDSGLEEFLHFETHGEAVPPPSGGERIPLAMGKDTGLVFVLIPGGRCWLGADKTDVESIGDMPNSDPHAIDDFWEESIQKDFEPFFLSKYEMTEGQWKHFVNQNRRVLGVSPQRLTSWPNKPMVHVTFDRCVAILGRLGLLVPNEEQWEYAARAGGRHRQTYWTGMDPASLEDHENIFEQTAANKPYAPLWYAQKERIEPGPFDDWRKAERFANGVGFPAPVGAYVPNGFGLFDVGGNVSEYCYPKKPNKVFCIVRGGNYRYGVWSARTAARKDVPRGFWTPVVGVRPAMAIQR